MGTMIVGMILSAIGGIIFGTHLPIGFQLVAFFAGIWYLNTDGVRGMEIGAIIPMMIVICFYAGMVIGDISWFIQTDAYHNINWINPFVIK